MKIRVKFSKQGNLRFVGHLDIMRYFQKAVRRSGLPIAYSEGFSPHQIMSFAAPLGMGLEGLGEYFDIRLVDGSEGKVTSAGAVELLNKEMAEGMEILSFLRIPDDAKNCMSIVHAADYTVRFSDENGSFEGDNGLSEILPALVSDLLSKDSIPAVKKGKNGKEREVDLKPMVFRLSAENSALSMCIAQGSEANLKPELLLNALKALENGSVLLGRKVRVVRTELYDSEMKALEAYGEVI